MVRSAVSGNHKGETEDLFSVNSELRQGLESLATTLYVRKGGVLFRQGQALKGIYILRHGKARLMASTHQKQLPYRVVGPGYILGLPATLTHKPYSLTAEVVEDAEFGFVPAKKALEYLGCHTEQCLHVVDFLGKELMWMRGRKISLLERTRTRAPRSR